MSERFSPNRDIQALCVEAIEGGWAVEKTRGNHLRFTAPNGAFVFGSQTPSDFFAVTNCRAEMRRAWPEWKPRPERERGPRPKRPGRSPETKTAWAWDGRAGQREPLTATLADVWPVTP